MSKSRLINYLCFFLILIGSHYTAALSQDPKKTETPNITVENPADDVIKINTNLIQTGVTVFDKKGQFIDKLTKDDFELRVDGKPVSVSFFDRVLPLNNNVSTIEKQNGEKTNNLNNVSSNSNLLGRTILFVVDDLHLAFDSQKRTRDLINKFIDREMLSDDSVVIVSTTGNVGFLQQFTSDKIVLHKAVERLINNRNTSGADRAYPPMSEYEASLIDHGDPQVTDTFAMILLREQPGSKLDSLRDQVRSRARNILFQVSIINKGTYSVLEQAIRNSGQFAGRKVVFFITDGFLLDTSNTDAAYRLRRITDAATRSNAVIYSFDAKGLDAGLPEGTTADASSPPGLGYRVQAGERFEVQDGPSNLATSTGGKFIHNTNDLQSGLSKVISEVSSYYLLAWEPASEIDKSDKLKRIEVSIKNHPEFQVRMQTGYLNNVSNTLTDKDQNKNKQDKADKNSNNPDSKPVSIIDVDLDKAIIRPIPLSGLPTAVVASYVDDPNEGSLLRASVQIKSDAIEFTQDSEKSSANINLLGIIYDSDGKRVDYFNKLLTIEAAASRLKENRLIPVFYNYQVKLKPGLYQVRVAARGAKTARVGSALQWILIPDLTSKKVTLSSLFLGEQLNNSKQDKSESKETSGIFEDGISVDRQFLRSSSLRYLVFIYNAAPGKTNDNLPEIFLQTRIRHGNDIVMSSPLNQVTIVKGIDTARIPFATDIPLDTLPVGRYELQITVEDHIAKTSAEQRVKFEVK